MKVWVVTGGYYDTNEIFPVHFEQCLGVFTSMEAAYGYALLYLDEFTEDGRYSISNLFELEGQTGSGMQVKEPDSTIVNFVNIFNATEVDQTYAYGMEG